ncbi:hypothetical protein L596_010798 [Steinernema carpocapsae]|uniref:Uncharacterized protein n=1 Tax=Steinernema carpocapsae TaxID=34508 RepID=A0A4U5PK27_STECR|nr:hypothetical protein L596_010798 [Steinernema carpocapsae]
MENEEISCSGSSFTTASPCSATVLSFGYAESDCDFSDSEVDSVVSESSCATAVPELEFVDSLVLLRSRCASASLLPPAEESEVRSIPILAFPRTSRRTSPKWSPSTNSRSSTTKSTGHCPKKPAST